MTTSRFSEIVKIEHEDLNLVDVERLKNINCCLLIAAYSRKPFPSFVKNFVLDLLNDKSFFIMFAQLRPDLLLNVDICGYDFANEKNLYSDLSKLYEDTSKFEIENYVKVLFTSENISDNPYFTNIADEFFTVNLFEKNWGFKLKEFLNGKF